jgi:WD40 repeat protein
MFSLDGALLFCTDTFNGTRAYDARSGHQIRAFQTPAPAASTLARASTGAAIAAGHPDGSISLWDSETGALMRMIQGHAGANTALCFASDDRILAAGGRDGTIELWHTATGELAGLLPQQAGWIDCISANPNGTIIATACAGGDHAIKLWDTATYGFRGELVGHSDDVECLAFSADSVLLASGSVDQWLRIWDVASGATRLAFRYTHDICGVAFQPNKAIVATAVFGDDELVHLLDIEHDRVLPGIEGPFGHPTGVVISPDGSLMAVSGIVVGEELVVFDLNAPWPDRVRKWA